MSGEATVHVLLVYSHEKNALVSQEQFRDARKATEAYEIAERDNRGNENYEIVLVASDSIETIMKTHGHYFRLSELSLFSEFLSEAP